MVPLVFRKALAKITIVAGMLVTLGFTFLLNHRSWPELAGWFLLFVVLQILLYTCWRWATSITQCPQCKNPRAKLSYNEEGREYLSCDACGLHQATGVCQPND